jgi:hypothetical protein
VSKVPKQIFDKPNEIGDNDEKKEDKNKIDTHQ